MKNFYKANNWFSPLIILFLSLVCSQTQAQESGRLWKIEHSKKKQIGYLYGTMHLIPKDEFHPPEILDSLIGTCAKVVTEVSLDMYIEEQFDMATSMVFGHKKTLADHLKKEDLNKLNRLLIDTLGFERSRLENQYYNLKPMFLSTIVLKELVGPITAADQWVVDVAKRDSIELGSLESIYEQIGFIDSIPMKEQLKWLTELNANMELEYRNMLRIYQNGDLDSLLILSQEDANSKADFELRSQRNANWIPRMEAHLLHGPVLFAMGALHLPGNDGVIALLREAGYRVKAIGN